MKIVTGVLLALMLVVSAPALAADEPAGQMTWALHFSLAPTLMEPAETPGLITPFMIIYALHDALVKPRPGKTMAPSLAESWTASADGLGEEVQRTPGLTLKPTLFMATHWLVLTDQWDRSSPWHDRWQPPQYAHDRAKARQLLAEAGYAKGFDAGDFWCDAGATAYCEPVLNELQAVGVKTKLRPLERAGFMKSYSEKKLKNIIYSLSGIFGNAATRMEPFVVSTGGFAYGGYPDIDGLFREQAGELDSKKREAMLHRIQQLIHDKAMVLPIWQLALIQAHGPGVAESGLGLITDYPWSAPYEDLKLKGK